MFVILVAFVRPRHGARSGTVFFSYVGLYSVGRFLIEAIRLDSFWIGGFRVAQLASVLGVMIAVVGLAWSKRRAERLAVG